MTPAAEQWTAYLATRCPRHHTARPCRRCAVEQCAGLDESEGWLRCQRLSDEYEKANWEWEIQ